MEWSARLRSSSWLPASTYGIPIAATWNGNWFQRFRSTFTTGLWSAPRLPNPWIWELSVLTDHRLCRSYDNHLLIFFSSVTPYPGSLGINSIHDNISVDDQQSLPSSSNRALPRQIPALSSTSLICQSVKSQIRSGSYSGGAESCLSIRIAPSPICVLSDLERVVRAEIFA